MLIFLFGGSFHFWREFIKTKTLIPFNPLGEGHATLARTLAVRWGEGIEDTYPHSLGGARWLHFVPLGTFHCYLKIVYLGLIAGLVPN